MDDLDVRLDSLLDRWTVAPLDRDLTSQVLARAAAEDKALDELLALAGSTGSRQAGREVTLTRDLTDSILGRARAEDAALDRLLTAASVPAMRQDVAGRVLRKARRGRLVRRIAVAAGSLAAAAAILVVATILRGPGRQPAETLARPPLAPDDKLVADNLDLIQDKSVLVHWDTIRAMEQLEQQAPDDRRL